ncbi:C13 family peptidase, partial [Sphingomonas sp. Leaf412]|uniref:C13 family peptidase n=1 Tax=Sphingomonas sp. Leaf412 TaxID=1736370 RepID=UPI000AB877B1
MDVNEDVLVLYTTSHGAPFGIYYNDGDQGYGAISPTRLWQQLSALGIRNRLIMVSACYSGVFVPLLSSDTTAILTASSADRTSFGCQSDNDWTFFGDALVNTALRRRVPLATAAAQAQALVAGWEGDAKLEPSQPQVSIGAGAAAWLAVLERDLPPDGARVGRAATASLKK